MSGIPQVPAPSADEAMTRARSGDTAAFGRVVDLLQDRLFNAVLRMTGDRDDAMDITQETFARGFASATSFRGDSGTYTWLFRIAYNLVISERRKARLRLTRSLDDALPDDQASALRDRVASTRASPDAQLRSAEQRDLVLLALKQLDPADRALLVMRDVDGQDYAQIGRVLDVPQGTVKSRLFRARSALRDAIERIGGEP
jgi:RNA polymerase sigma-70 factor (ECF subfamily)